MFKAASDYEQGRSRRVVLSSRKNTGGVDPTIFTAQEARLRKKEIAQRRQEVERKLGKITASITESNRRKSAWVSERPARPEVEARWHQERRDLLEELRRLDADLSEAKMAMLSANNVEHKTFAEAFLDTAREVLVPAVFERLVAITNESLGVSSLKEP